MLRQERQWIHIKYSTKITKQKIIRNRKRATEYISILNSTSLNNPQAKEKISREIQKYFELGFHLVKMKAQLTKNCEMQGKQCLESN